MSSASLNRLLLRDRKQNPSLERDGNPCERARQEKQCIHGYRAAHPLPQDPIATEHMYNQKVCCQHDSMASLSWQHDSCSMWFHIRSHRREQWCTVIAHTRTEDCYRAICSDSVDCAYLNWGWHQSYLFWSCTLCRIKLMSRKKMCNTAGLHQAVNVFKSVLCKCMRYDCSITCTARTHSCSVIDLPLCALRFLLL